MIIALRRIEKSRQIVTNSLVISATSRDCVGQSRQSPSNVKGCPEARALQRRPKGFQSTMCDMLDPKAHIPDVDAAFGRVELRLKKYPRSSEPSLPVYESG